MLPQATVHEFVSRGRLEPNVERARPVEEAADAMLGAEEELPRARRGAGPGRLLHLGGLPGRHGRRAFLDRATERGVTVKGTTLPARAGVVSSACLRFVSPGEIRARRPSCRRACRAEHAAGCGIAARAARRTEFRARARAATPRSAAPSCWRRRSRSDTVAVLTMNATTYGSRARRWRA